MTEAEFTEQVWRCRVKMLGIARRYCTQGIEPEDVLQDALIKAWLCRERLEQISKFNCWLHTIIRNEALSQRRKLHAGKRGVELPLDPAFDIIDWRAKSTADEYETRSEVNRIMSVAVRIKPWVSKSLSEYLEDNLRKDNVGKMRRFYAVLQVRVRLARADKQKRKLLISRAAELMPNVHPSASDAL